MPPARVYFALICVAAWAATLGGQGRARATAQPARPNFLIIVADDMGFSDAGCYGGEIATPNLDRLAAGGLRFTQFYNTARCWPTRACILSGYYAQQVRMDPPKGRLPGWARVLPHYLKPLGYRCYHVGKWHLMGARRPVADGGFDHSWCLEDHDRYFAPRMVLLDDQLQPPVPDGTNFYVTTAMADYSLEFLRQHQREHAGRPFLLYLAFTAPHFPLHAPSEDVARYRERYLEGWDVVRQRRWERMRQMGIVQCALSTLDPKLAPRYFKREFLERLGPGEVDRAVPWADLSPAQKEFQAAKMAVHAAMVDRMDREIGRVLEQIRAMGAWDNTVIFFLSDNGADATILIRGDGHDPAAEPGSGQSFLCLGPGWASASNAPFRRHKIWVHEGGIATPLIVHWPQGISARGQLRHDVGHVIDFVPTLLELAGARAEDLPRDPSAPPLPGRSLVPTFARDGAVVREFLFFKHEGNRALRMGDWKLVSARETGDVWELFNLRADRCEMVDLAAREPNRVRQMEARWRELDAQFARHAAAP